MDRALRGARDLLHAERREPGRKPATDVVVDPLLARPREPALPERPHRGGLGDARSRGRNLRDAADLERAHPGADAQRLEVPPVHRIEEARHEREPLPLAREMVVEDVLLHDAPGRTRTCGRGLVLCRADRQAVPIIPRIARNSAAAPPKHSFAG